MHFSRINFKTESRRITNVSDDLDVSFVFKTSKLGVDRVIIMKDGWTVICFSIHSLFFLVLLLLSSIFVYLFFCTYDGSSLFLFISTSKSDIII